MTAEVSASRLMVLGIGNADRGDDGIGLRVADELSGRLPPGTLLIKRSGDLLGLVDEWSGIAALVCVDAAAADGQPGRLHRLDLDRDDLPPGPATSSHALGLAEVIALSQTLGTAPSRVIVFAIEGENFETGAPIGEAVAAAGQIAGRAIVAEVASLLSGIAEPA